MVRPQICMDQQPGTAGWKPGTQWCCTAGCSCHQHPSQKWLFFGVIKAIPGSLATPNARLRIADFHGCTANRSVLCPVTIDSSSAVGVRNDPMKKKHVSRLNDIMTYIQYIYIYLYYYYYHYYDYYISFRAAVLPQKLDQLYPSFP
jgi:hypothetical protein